MHPTRCGVCDACVVSVVCVVRGGRYFGIVRYFRYLHHTEWLDMDRLGISKNQLFQY